MNTNRRSPHRHYLLLTTIILATTQAHAADFYWAGTLSPNWNDIATLTTNWRTDLANNIDTTQLPDPLADIFFATTTPTATNLTTTLGQNFSINSFHLLPGIGPVSIENDGYTLTLGSGGIDMSAATQTLSIHNPIALSANQTWNTATQITVSGPLSAGTRALTLAGPGNVTINGLITGSGTLSKTGTGTLTLNTGSTYTGTMTISAGTLRSSESGTLMQGTLLVNNPNALVDLNNHANDVLVTRLDSGTIAGGTLTSGKDFDLRSGTVTASLSGTAGLFKNTSGTVELWGNNSYSSATIISSGTLVLMNPDALGSTGNIYILIGGLLRYSTYNTTDYSARLVSNGGNTSFTIDTNGQQVTFSASINPSTAFVPFTKVGSGTLTFAAPNLYTGLTTVSGGVLRYAVNDAIATGAVTLDGGTLDLNDHADTVGSVSLRNDAALIGGTLTSTGGFGLQSGFVSTVLSGIGKSLSKSSSATVQLAAATTFTGSTILTDGVLTLAHPDALGATSSIILAGGTLQFSAGCLTDYSSKFSNSSANPYKIDTGGQSIAFNSPLTNIGGLGFLKTGAGTLTYNTVNSYTGTTTIAAGVLIIAHPNALGAGPLDIQANASVRLVPGFSGAVKLPSLAIAHVGAIYNATFDLTDGKLVLQATTNSNKQSKIADLATALNSGKHNGDWLGKGITSSTLSTSGTTMTNSYALGLFDNAIHQKTSFGNQPTDTNSLLLTIAHLGDTNLDGTVDIQDLGVIANNWQTTNTTWSRGDLNLDGVIDIQDLGILANNWQQTSNFSLSPLVPQSLSAFDSAFRIQNSAFSTPEPNTLLLLTTTLPLLLRKRKLPHPSVP